MEILPLVIPYFGLLSVLLIHCVLISHPHLSLALDIYVNQENGTTEDCCLQGEACLTLNLALNCLRQNNHSTTWIKPGTYHLNATGGGDGNYEFSWMQDIAIVAVNELLYFSDAMLVRVVCNSVSIDHGAGLTFLNSTNVTIRGIMFDGCGVYHHSTSRSKINSSSEAFRFFATLYFMLCTDITLEYVHVNGTSGIGVVIYSTVGLNRILNCNFSHNADGGDGSSPGGGGVYIEFAYCLHVPGQNDLCDRSTNVPTHNTNSAHYKIESVTFYKNNATVSNATNLPFILPYLNKHIAFGRGGGLSIFFKGGAFNNTISVSNSTFTDNYAQWGAGLFVEYQDNACNNSFVMENSIIDSNICHNSESESEGTGGGGARVGYIFFTYGLLANNSIAFSDVLFHNNKAYFGGGLSFHVAREAETSNPTNLLTFNRCHWWKNVARVGSAADISIWHPIVFGAVVKPTFTNCEFINNSASYTTKLGSPVGKGALYIDSVPVTFNVSVSFISNTHTALAAISTGIYFEEDCHAYFLNNQGQNGGAVALMGNSFIQVSKQTEMKFVNNSAELKGGAIYGCSIGEHDLISSRNCFVRYKDFNTLPQNWLTRFMFENNTAANGNSIYVTSLLTCLWGETFGSTETVQDTADKVFCWSNATWSYSSPCSLEISTSPSRFIISNSSETVLPTYNATVIPGMRTNIDLSTSDDRDNNVTEETVLTARLFAFNSSNSMTLDNNSQYISDRTYKIYGKPGSVGTLRLQTIDPRVISTEVKVELQHCPPGMVLGSSASCECIGDYGGYIDCNHTSFSAKILRGSWIGSSSKSSRKDTFLVGQCPYCFLVGFEQYIPLPQNASMLPDVTCKRIKRKGELCGRCEDGMGPVVNGDFECIPCSAIDAKFHWLLYFLSGFVPIIIFFSIVVCFNVSVTSGPGNAFIFFAQVIAVFSLTADGAVQIKDIANAMPILRYIYSLPYEIWNLNFFYHAQFCISSEISPLQILAVTGYTTALFPLLLVVIFYVLVSLYSAHTHRLHCLDHHFKACSKRLNNCFANCHYYRRTWNLKRSVLHALATFLLLSYTKFSVVSFILLTPTPLLYDDGSTDRLVLYYDGTIDFFHPEHAPYAAPALFFLLVFVILPPFILILPSLSHSKCVQKERCECRHLPSHQVGSVLGQFITVFHACYKDGTGRDDNKNDFRWFAGLYFIFRLIIFAVYAFTPDWFMQYAILQLVCIGGFLAFALLRPYKNDWYNKLDATIFAILAAINTLSMYNYFLAVAEGNPSVWIFFMQYFLVMCPLGYIVVFVVHYLFKTFKTCCKCTTAEGNEGDNQDFIEFTEQTGRLGVCEGTNYVLYY